MTDLEMAKSRTKYFDLTTEFFKESTEDFTRISQRDLIVKFLRYLELGSHLDLRPGGKKWVSKPVHPILDTRVKEKTLFLDKEFSTADQKGRVGVPARLRKGLPKLVTVIFVNNDVAFVVPRSWPFKKYPVASWRGLHLEKLDCQNRLMMHMPMGKVKVSKHGDWSHFYLRFEPVRPKLQ